MKRLLFIPFILWASCAQAYHHRLVGVIGKQAASGGSWGIEDDFSTNTISNYTVGDGSMTISAGAAHGGEWANSRVYYNTDLSTSNTTAIGDIVYNASNDSAGVGCRMSTTNGYQAYFAGGVLKLSHSYTFSEIGTYSGSYGSDTYSVQIKCNGSTISVDVNGVQRISVTNSEYTTGTKVGMIFRKGAGSFDTTVDNFKGGTL